MGKDRAAAVDAAIELNAMLATNNHLASRITSQGTRLSKFIERYEEILVTEKKQAPKTIKETKTRLRNICSAFGHFYMSQLDVLKIADFLDRFPPRQSNCYRALLADIYKWAVAKGVTDTNPVKGTIAKKVKVARIRWTMEGYQAAKAEAPPFVQRAMDIALHTLLRREDLVSLRFSQYKDDRLNVATHKTKAHISIKAGPELDRIIRSCRDDALSPCIIHYPLGYRRGHEGKCLTPEALTRAVQRARDRSGFYAGQSGAPTLHEIRSLGAKLYEEQGVNPQALLGHADEKMTRVYLDRYETKWIDAEARLKI